MKVHRILMIMVAAVITYTRPSIGQVKRGISGKQIVTPWASSVNLDSPHPEYPRPQFVRNGQWENLNGKWLYSITKFYEDSIPTFQDTIIVPYAIESSLSMVQRPLNPDETLWYKRNFSYNPSNLRTLLNFGAVDYKSTIYINGKVVGSHEGGYTSFQFDVTDYLNAGENELIVRVSDPTDQGIGPHGKQILRPASIYYTPCSGIWQTVWLEHLASSYLAGVKYTIDFDKPAIIIKPDVVAYGDDRAQLQLDVQLKFGNRVVSAVIKNIDSVFRLDIKDPKIWSPDTPNLYSVKYTLFRDKEKIDEVKGYCGFRHVAVLKGEDGISRMTLNKKFIFNLGVLDQGYWPDGLYTAPTDAALLFDIVQAKRMGFNAIRKHMKIEPSRWYYYADSVGILVWQDFINPNQGLPHGARDAFEKQVCETISQLWNHPCINVWVLFNERWGAYDQRRLTNWVRTLDPNRIVNGHSGEYLFVNNVLRATSEEPYVSSDVVDYHSYPFPIMPQRIDDKALVIGEFGGLGVSVPNHIWNSNENGWGYSGLLSSEKMIKQYSAMIDTLNVYKKNGLSAAIYTQPYDVESEQNGIMTYDRKVIKIPIGQIFKINQKIVASRHPGKFKNLYEPIVFKSSSPNYQNLIAEFRCGRNDSIFLRTLFNEAWTRSDSAIKNDALRIYLQIVLDPLANDNVVLIEKASSGETEVGFNFTVKNYEKIIKSEVGRKCVAKAQQVVKNRLDPVFLKSTKENINLIDTLSAEWFGPIAKPVALNLIAFYYYRDKDYETWFKYKKIIYESYSYYANIFDLNNDAWLIFTNSENIDQLRTALSWSRRVIDEEPTANYYDTYANILYKMGNKDEAIHIQRKALLLTAGNGDKQDVINNLKKMENNQPTWK